MARNHERTMKVGDTGEPMRARVTQDSNGNAPDWTSASVRFFMLQIAAVTGALTEKVNAVASVELPEATSGGLVYNWVASDTDTAGRFMAFFEVITAAGVKETYPREDFIWVNIEERG